MKRQLKFLSLFLGVILSISMTGCSNSDSDDDVTLTSLSVGGTLLEEGAGGASISTFAAENYIVFVQNQANGYAYETTVTDQGVIDLDLEISDDEGGNCFMGILINKNLMELAGTILAVDGDDSDHDVSGFCLDDDISGLEIRVDSEDGRGVIQTPDDVSNFTLKDTFKVNIGQQDGKPIGFGNKGKGAGSKLGNKNSGFTYDPDQDGIPNGFDAMNDGATLDNLSPGPKADGIFGRPFLSHAIMFMNLKIDRSDANDADIVTDHATIVLEVQESGRAIFPITEVRADLMHANYTGMTFDRQPSGFTDLTDPTAYPSEGSSWSSPNSLYKLQNLDGRTVWTAILRPDNGQFAPGNLVRLRVTRASSRVTYHWLSINFKFTETVRDQTDWASISTSGSGTSSDPFVIPDGDDIDLSWLNPLDEDGTALTGLEYDIELFYYDDSNPGVQVGDRRTKEDFTNASGLSSLDPTSFTLEAAEIDFYATPPSGEPDVALLQIDITARYPFGDNAASKVYIKRASW